jgi:hypothetical protein
MIKLVDRIEFARANFNLAKDWKLWRPFQKQRRTPSRKRSR